MIKTRMKALVAAALLGAFATLPAVAQPRDEQVATDLSLEQLDEPLHGSMAMVDGRLDGGKPDRYTVANLTMFQPVKISLVAESRPVRLQLGKFDWKEDFDGGSTDSSGTFVKSFKTQGDLLLTVNGEPGAGYRLIVWAGDEVIPEMEPVLVPGSEAGSGMSKLVWIGLALLAALGIGWWLMKRRRSAA
jgi:LPXTG-motif cell wall-anchored protein